MPITLVEKASEATKQRAREMMLAAQSLSRDLELANVILKERTVQIVQIVQDK